MPSILDNPLVIYGAVAVILLFVIYSIFKKPNFKFKEFIPVKFEKTVYDEVKEKMKEQGIKTKGHFRLGFNVIATVDRWMEKKGKFSNLYYNKKTKEYEEQINAMKDAKESNYDLVILRAKSNNIIFRLIGMKKQYYILHRDSIVSFDETTNTWATKETDDLIRYGNVWMNSSESMEWVNNISLKNAMESTMTQVQNFPDRLVHLEVQQAKRNQILAAQGEADRAKYDKSKQADETTYG